MKFIFSILVIFLLISCSNKSIKKSDDLIPAVGYKTSFKKDPNINHKLYKEIEFTCKKADAGMKILNEDQSKSVIKLYKVAFLVIQSDFCQKEWSEEIIGNLAENIIKQKENIIRICKEVGC